MEIKDVIINKRQSKYIFIFINILRISHLGKNPNNGGIPARDRMLKER